MLVEFSVANYGPFVEKQTISFVPVAGLPMEDENTFKTGDTFAPRLLKSIAIFGASGSGKTALIKAFDLLRTVACYRIPRDENLFKLRPVPPSKPIELRALVKIGDNYYDYSVAFNQKRIVKESLRVTRVGNMERTFFSCDYNPRDKLKTFDVIDESIVGLCDLKVDRLSINRDESALQYFAKANHEPCKLIYEYLQQGFKIFDILKADSAWPLYYGYEDLCLEWIKEALQTYGIPYELQGKKYDPFWFRKKGAKSNGTLPLDKLPRGASTAISMHLYMKASQQEGTPLIVDDLGAFLHPKVLHKMVVMAKEMGVQLLFTTNCTYLLSVVSPLRRDQIYFVDYDMHFKSSLYSLAEFIQQPDEENGWESRYLSGSYLAVPVL